MRRLRRAVVAVPLLLALACGSSASQDAPPPPPGDPAVVFRAEVPASTPPADTVYLADSFDGFAAPVAMTTVTPTTHVVTRTIPAGTHVEFKLHRGTWTTVEKEPDCSESRNHVWDVTGPATVDVTIARWADQCP